MDWYILNSWLFSEQINQNMTFPSGPNRYENFVSDSGIEFEISESTKLKASLPENFKDNSLLMFNDIF